MAQNTVQDKDLLYPEDEIVYIASYSTSMTSDSLTSFTGASWTNIGALAEFSREAKIETQQPPSQNVEHQQQISKMGETINVTIQELSPTVMNILNGTLAQTQVVTGSSTSAIDTYTTSQIPSTAYEKFTPFKNQSWSSTSGSIPIIPTGIVLAGTSTYVLDTEYYIIQNELNEWGWIINSTGAITSTATITMSYSYVPKAQTILWNGGADEITPFQMKVYSITADGRTITSYYPRVEFVSGGAINDKDGASGAFKDVKYSLEAREHESFTYNGKKQYKVEVLVS